MKSPRQSTSTTIPGERLTRSSSAASVVAGLGRERRERPLERAAQVGERLLHLDPAALALRLVERLLGAQRERHAEQPLEHALVDLARQLEPLGQAPRPLLLARHVARRRDQRGRLPERPQQVPLAVGELEPPAAAVGADHPVRAPRRAQRRAHERRDPEQLGVLGRDLLLDPLGDHDHLVLEQRALRDRRVDERRAQRRQLLERGPVRADRAHAPAVGVGHEDRRPPHRRQPADRLADPVVELGRRRLHVDVGEQLDEHLERLDAGEQRRRAVSDRPHRRAHAG